MRRYVSSSDSLPPRPDFESVLRKQLNESLLRAVVSMEAPLIAFSDEDFQAVLDLLAPGASQAVASPKTLTRAAISKARDVLHSIGKEITRSGSFVALADGWSDLVGRKYLGGYAFYITEAFDYKTACLGLVHVGSKASLDTNLAFRKLMRKHAPPLQQKLLTSMTSDNEPAMVAFVTTLGVPRTPCFAHVINLGLEAALQPYGDLESKVRLCLKRIRQALLKFARPTFQLEEEAQGTPLKSRAPEGYVPQLRNLLRPNQLLDRTKHRDGLPPLPPTPAVTRWETRVKQLTYVTLWAAQIRDAITSPEFWKIEDEPGSKLNDLDITSCVELATVLQPWLDFLCTTQVETAPSLVPYSLRLQGLVYYCEKIVQAPADDDIGEGMNDPEGGNAAGAGADADDLQAVLGLWGRPRRQLRAPRRDEQYMDWSDEDSTDDDSDDDSDDESDENADDAEVEGMGMVGQPAIDDGALPVDDGGNGREDPNGADEGDADEAEEPQEDFVLISGPPVVNEVLLWDWVDEPAKPPEGALENRITELNEWAEEQNNQLSPSTKDALQRLLDKIRQFLGTILSNEDELLLKAMACDPFASTGLVDPVWPLPSTDEELMRKVTDLGAVRRELLATAETEDDDKPPDALREMFAALAGSVGEDDGRTMAGKGDKEVAELARELMDWSLTPDLTYPSLQSVLVWWKSRAHMYPILAKISRKYLAVPCSAAAQERVFSCAGRHCTPFRSSLSPETLDALVTLKMNKKWL